jgi:cation/acetate symporter
VLFIGWYFRYLLVAVFAPGSCGPAGAGLSMSAGTHINVAFFPLDDPGIVSIPLAFFLGWLGSVTGRPPSDPARFARVQVRALTGVGAERGGHN